MAPAVPSGGLHDRSRPAAGAKIFGLEALFAPLEGPRPGDARERRPRPHGGRHVACSTWRERRENRTTGGRVSTAGGSKSRAEEAAGGQQTHAIDGKKNVHELGRGWQGRRSPPELPLAIKCRCAHEKEVVVSAAGVDDLPMHMNGRDRALSKGLSRQARMG